MLERSGRQSPRLGELLSPDANNFAVLRLLAALAVLISHAYLIQSGKSANEPLRSLTGYSLGSHGVQVFFFLSGILVTHSWVRSTSLLDFSVARALRIVPGFAICVLLVAFLFGPLVSAADLSGYFASNRLPAYLAKTLSLSTGSAGLPALFQDNPLPDVVNQSVWTLKYEIICYALVGFLGLAFSRFGSGLSLAVAAFSGWAAIMLILPPGLGEGNSALANLHYFLLFFGLGVFAYAARQVLVLNGYAVAALFLLFAISADSIWNAVAAALFLGYGSLYLASLEIGPLRRIANRYDLSYGLYLYSFPVSQTLMTLYPDLQPEALIVITVSVSVPLALTSWLAIERPSLGVRRSLVEYLRQTQNTADSKC